MNKKELIDSLAKKIDFVGFVGVPTNLNSQEIGNTNRYNVAFLEIVGDVMKPQNVDFYVMSEGNPDETAYWKDKEPVQTIGV